MTWTCTTCSEGNEGEGDNCWNCGTSRYTHYNQPPPEPIRKSYARNPRPGIDEFEIQPSLVQTGLILSSTPTLQTHTITDYLNVVSGEAILGINVLNDLVAGLSDLLGGRAAGYERAVKEARQLALSEVVQKATQLEAHGVVGLFYETQVINTMLMVSCWGTAVRLKPTPISNIEEEI